MGRLSLAFLVLRILYVAWPRKSVRGRVILVTGGGQGIGREIALAAARRGAHLVLWDLNEMGLEESKGLVVREGVKCFTYRVDVSRRENVYAAAECAKRDVKAAFGADGYIWGIVNNAGIVSGSPFLDTPDERIVKTYEVNSLAHLWVWKAFLPDMLEANDGHVATIASAAGLFGAARMVDYCGSKFAAVGATEALRMEIGTLNKPGVRTSLVCPAHVSTNLFEGYKSATRTMTPAYMGSLVLDAIEQRKSFVAAPREVYMGLLNKVLLPTAVNDALNNLSGVGSAMNTWKSAHAEKVFKAMK